MTGVHLGGESDSEMEELLPKGKGEGGMFDDSCVVIVGGGGDDSDDGPTLVPSESLVVQL